MIAKKWHWIDTLEAELASLVGGCVSGLAGCGLFFSSLDEGPDVPWAKLLGGAALWLLGFGLIIFTFVPKTFISGKPHESDPG